MAYSQKGGMNIKLAAGSLPSLHPNNFCIADGMMTYLKGNDVIVSSTAGNSKVLPEVTRSTVHCATFVTCNRRKFLVVGSSGGAQVWCSDGADMKYFCALSALMENVDESSLDNHCVRCATGCGSSHIVLGGSNGFLYVLDVPPGDGEGISQLHKLNVSDAARYSGPSPGVMAVHGSGSDHVVCANENGDIVSFDSENAYAVSCYIPATTVKCSGGSLVTALLMRFDTIVAGYNTGHVRVFRRSVQELAVEICAHSRAVSALSLHPSSPLFLSCSEDQTLRVWEFPEFSNKATSDADLIHSERFENRICTGACFYARDSVNADHIAVAFYDDDEVVVLARSSC